MSSETSEPVARVPPAENPSIGTSATNPINTLLLNAGITILIVVITLVAYHLRYDHGATGIGTVDVADIYNNARTKLAERYMKTGLSDQEKLAIKNDYDTFGKKLETTINQIMAECRCVLMAREAVLTTNAVDYTPEAIRRMGL